MQTIGKNTVKRSLEFRIRRRISSFGFPKTGFRILRGPSDKAQFAGPLTPGVSRIVRVCREGWYGACYIHSPSTYAAYALIRPSILGDTLVGGLNS